MNKLAIIPIFFLTMCGTAPITDDPAHACSLPLDGSPANCPNTFDDIKLPRENIRGEIDIWNPHHFIHMQSMFIRNERRTQIEENATLPSDAINSALDDFMEAQYGSDGSTEQEKLL